MKNSYIDMMGQIRPAGLMFDTWFKFSERQIMNSDQSSFTGTGPLVWWT